MDIFLLPLFGILAGILAGVFGIGGGTIIVPTMLLLGYSVKEAIGISVMQMMFSSLYGSAINFKKKKLNLYVALYVALGGAFGAAFSGFIVHYTQDFYLKLALVAVSFYSMFKHVTSPSHKHKVKEIDPKKMKFILLGIGFITGIFAISIGIGGGLIIVPLVGYYVGLNTKEAVPISLFFIVFSSFSGFISLISYEQLDYLAGFIVGICSIVGVHAGIKLINFLSPKSHKIAVVILYVAVLSIMLKSLF